MEINFILRSGCLQHHTFSLCYSFEGSWERSYFKNIFLDDGWNHIFEVLFIWTYLVDNMGFPDGSVVKNLPANAGHCRFNPWIGKISWRWKCNLFWYSCLGNPMDRGSWQAIVHGVSNTTTIVDNIFSIITFNPCVN